MVVTHAPAKETYTATVKKLGAAYAALRVACATAEYFEGLRIARGLEGLQAAADA